MLGFLGAGFLIANSYSDWQESPVATTTRTLPIADLDFPTVTVCPPKGSNTALTHDLKKADNNSLSQKDRDELKNVVFTDILEPSHQEYIRLMLATAKEDNMVWLLKGFQAVPKGYKENGLQMNTLTENLNGTYASPWYHKKYDEKYYKESKHQKLIINFPENVGELLGSGSLVIQLEVDTREEQGWQEQVRYREGHSYKLYWDWTPSWSAAEAHCQKEGGHLASVLTEEEQEEVRLVAEGQEVWLGGSDQEQEGVWQWADGSPWYFNKWRTASGEPNGKEFENCVNFQNGDWLDIDCIQTKNFICQSNTLPVRPNTTLTLMYNKEQLTFKSFNVWYDYISSNKKLLNSWEDKRMTGFRLRWFLQDNSGTQVMDGTNTKPRFEEPYLAKMVKLATLARAHNVTRTQIVQRTIKEKTRIILNGRLNYKDMCSGGQVKETEYKWIFEATYLGLPNETTEGNPDKEDIITGFMMFSAIVYCSEPVALSQFLHTLLSTESPRTIIQATVSTIEQEDINGFVNSEYMAKFYLALDRVFHFQLGQILVATASPTELQAMLDMDWPYFKSCKEELIQCLGGVSCLSVLNTLGR